MGNDTTLRRLTDQILYRFTHLQDAMGERLVPATVTWLREPQATRTSRRLPNTRAAASIWSSREAWRRSNSRSTVSV